ncbi:MAG: PcfB family protein [Oscillospiraceae bacterium]
MDYSGDSTEQIFKITLDGAEIALKLVGKGAKEIAAMLYAILTDKKRTKGKIRMASMLKSDKPLEFFSISEDKLKIFAQEAKKYGIMFSAIRSKNSDSKGTVDIMIKAEDAGRINHILERGSYTTVEAEKTKTIIEKSNANELGSKLSEIGIDANQVQNTNELMDFLEKAQSESAKEQFSVMDSEDIIDDLMGTAGTPSLENPMEAMMESASLSEPTSSKGEKSSTGRDKTDKPSVREQLREIKSERKEKETMQRESINTPQEQVSPQHTQPTNKPIKSRKMKER